MKKEKFLYELIDNYAYLTCLGCMVMENYLTVDKTKNYIDCADQLRDCLDFYDYLYREIDNGKYTEEEVDVVLDCLVLSLKQKAIQSIYTQLKNKACRYIPDAGKFMENNLLKDEKGNDQEITEKSLIQFIKALRKAETSETV